VSITIRPEREQAEHDRLIHFLQGKYDKDNYEVVANPGDEQNAAVRIATRPHFPDLVLNSDKKLAGVVEIETAASVNRLETMYKWVPFSRARVPFHLYVPVQGYDTALRLVETHQVKAAEIWTYRPAIEGFDLVRMYVDASAEKAARASSGSSRPARPAKAAKAAKTAKRAPAASPRASSTGTGKARSTARPATRAKAAKAAKSTKAAKATASAGRRKAAAPARNPAKRASASSTRRTPARATAKTTKATKAAKKSTGARGRR